MLLRKRKKRKHTPQEEQEEFLWFEEAFEILLELFVPIYACAIAMILLALIVAIAIE